MTHVHVRTAREDMVATAIRIHLSILTVVVQQDSMKNTESEKIMTSDQTEAEALSRAMGDQEILVAGDKEEVSNYEKSGSQSSEYYKK